MTNYTDRPLVFGTDIKLYQSDREAYLVDPATIGQEIKQNPPIHLLYLLLTFVNLTITSNNDVTTVPIGLVLGPGISLGNIAT